MPEQPNPWRLLTAFNTPGKRWPGALRAALAVLIPGSLAILLGYQHEMLLIAAGSFTVFYGEGHPYRSRWRVMSIAGLLLALGAMSGGFVGTVVWGNINAGGSTWWLGLSGLFTLVTATAGAFLQNALRLTPPGSFFIVMTAGGSTMVARLGLNPVDVGLWALVGAVSAVCIGMFPALVHPHYPETQAVDTVERAVTAYADDPHRDIAKKHQAESALQNAWFALSDAGIVSGSRIINEKHAGLAQRALAAHQELAQLTPSHTAEIKSEEMADSPVYLDLSRTSIPHSRPSIAYRVYRSAHPYSHGTITAVKVLTASSLALLLSLILDLGRPDWAIVGVLLTLQWGPDRVPGTVRGLHRLIGSIVGVLLFAGLAALGIHGWSLLLTLAVCSFFAEILVVKNYALCVIFTTPLALLMGGAISQPLDAVVVSRSVEMLLAAIFAIGVLWLLLPNAEPKHHARLVSRCYQAMGNLLGALLTAAPDRVLPERRDLQYELLSERRAAASLAINHPAVAAREWEHHVYIQKLGYKFLDSCTLIHDREFTMSEIKEIAQDVRNAEAMYRD